MVRTSALGDIVSTDKYEYTNDTNQLMSYCNRGSEGENREELQNHS